MPSLEAALVVQEPVNQASSISGVIHQESCWLFREAEPTPIMMMMRNGEVTLGSDLVIRGQDGLMVGASFALLLWNTLASAQSIQSIESWLMMQSFKWIKLIRSNKSYCF